MCDDLSFINTTQKTLKSKKNFSISRMDEKKLHSLEFQLKSIGGNMRYKYPSKKVYWKNNRVFQTLATYHH